MTRVTAIERYLQRYAELEALNVRLSSIGFADAVLVIPAYKESTEFLLRLMDQPFQGIGKVLLILVSNHPNDLVKDELNEALSFHQDLTALLGVPIWSDDLLSYYSYDNLDVLLVNKTGQHAIDRESGVGLARKIGADIALMLINKGSIRLPWIFNTDADTQLPHTYFNAVTGVSKEVSAICFAFQHIGEDQKLMDATDAYETRLNQYVNGLKQASSPYAFHTIGSTIAIAPGFYANVRGFPKRAAGEDFYLLNKLAKIGNVRSLDTPILEIDARCSNRIPFGTGPSVQKLMNVPDVNSEKILYNPEIFRRLSSFLPLFRADNSISNLSDIPDEFLAAARSIGMQRFLDHVDKQKLTGEHYQTHFHLWFDAFKTLKWVHFMRDNGYPNISITEFQALSKSERCANNPNMPPV